MSTAHCLTCPWTHHGDDADSASAKHTKDFGHATTVMTVGREA